MVYQTFLRQCHGGTYTGIIRHVTHMMIRRFTLILVRTLEATYSTVATGRKTGAIHDELWLTFATTHQARTVSKTW
jgi:hypothetical protein